MTNQDIEFAQAYHEATKLTYINLRNKPPLYKSYAGLATVSLPANFSSPEVPTLDAVARVERITPLSSPLVRGDIEGSIDLTALAQMLFFSAGLIRKGTFPAAGEVHFRAAASAGALYPVEAYVVCKDIPGL